MRKIHIEPLTKEAFAPYGQFYPLESPEGYPLAGAIHKFFPDRIVAYQPHNVGFSPLLVKKPAEMKITQVEYHTHSGELILPLNDDVVLHVAEPSAGKPIPDHTRAFLVPKHTLVKINACIWHLCPLPVNVDELAALIILPECTYINDCTVVDLSEDEQFLIEQ